MSEVYCRGDKVRVLRNSRPSGSAGYDVAEGVVGEICMVKHDGGSEGVVIFTNQELTGWLWVGRDDIRKTLRGEVE